jgi:hypothetical protein
LKSIIFSLSLIFFSTIALHPLQARSQDNYLAKIDFVLDDSPVPRFTIFLDHEKRAHLFQLENRYGEYQSVRIGSETGYNFDNLIQAIVEVENSNSSVNHTEGSPLRHGLAMGAVSAVLGLATGSLGAGVTAGCVGFTFGMLVEGCGISKAQVAIETLKRSVFDLKTALMVPTFGPARNMRTLIDGNTSFELSHTIMPQILEKLKAIEVRVSCGKLIEK